MAQLPEEEIIYSVANAHMNNYFPAGAREMVSIDTIFYDNEPDIFIVNLKDGGWLLISGDKRVIPVLGFSYEGYFTLPDKEENIASCQWIASYSRQIKEVRKEKGLTVHQGWKMDDADAKGMEEDMVVVEPLIKTLWNQGYGWNRFCPEDSLGPGGHTYVGCVAVALAQALSVYQVPDTGTSSYQIYSDDYGLIEAKFNETNYKWDSMSLDEPDDYNALLLFHCAVAVNMDFGPDGSSARTSFSRWAMGSYFKMTKRATYLKRINFDEGAWVTYIIDDLLLGRPIIYRGTAEDGESGHAFNIDGVNGQGSKGSNYFHVNWGWGGSHNGYYLIDDLKPGSHDYSENHLAVFRIQPYYYPTDVIMEDTLVQVGVPAGTAIGLPEVVNEAYVNDYEIILISDSVYKDNEWINDYYLENDSVKTGRVFTEDDIGKDTIRFIVTDNYDNTVEADVILEVTLFTGSAKVDQYDFKPDGINIYPNPTTGIVNIDIPREQPVEYMRMYSQSGLLVREIRKPSGYIRIDTDGFSQGLYIVGIKFSDGSAEMQKLLIL